MIPEYAIKEWGNKVPWNSPELVEQDLVICRALVAIFNDDFLGDTTMLLRPEESYNQNEAYNLIKEELIEKL